MDHRLNQLTTWITQTLPDLTTPVTLHPVSGDASFRRYFRLSLNGQSLIAMDSPPDKEPCDSFLTIAQHWRTAGLAAPDIIAADPQQGFVLLTDFGDCLFATALKTEPADALYRLAIDHLIAIQLRGLDGGLSLPPYSRELLLTELELFSHWLVERKLGLELSAAERELIHSAFTILLDNALQQPQVCVHRDYHSRNLLVQDDGQLGIIDFQDAVIGPISYDLVSLIRDCYVTWPAAQVHGWRDYYLQQAQHAGLMNEQDALQFPAWFDRMGMQRHLKAAGIFARLHLRDGKDSYLPYIPNTLNYVVQAGADDLKLAPFADWLDRRVLPLATQRLQPEQEH